MLLLRFCVKEDTYAINAEKVIEVIPFVRLQAIAKAPKYIAGVFNFRDVSVPVIDLCFLLKNSHCNNHFSTRIVLIEYLMDKGNKHVLGMLAEQVTETFKSDANDMISSGVTIKNAPYLEKVVLQDKEVIQFIDVKNLLPKSVQSMLFR